MSPILFAVYVLGSLTIVSFLVFVFSLMRYLKTPTISVKDQGKAATGNDQLEGLDPTKLFDAVSKTIKATRQLAETLNRAKPVAISALLTILFLIGWLVSLTLFVFANNRT